MNRLFMASLVSVSLTLSTVYAGTLLQVMTEDRPDMVASALPVLVCALDNAQPGDVIGCVKMEGQPAACEACEASDCQKTQAKECEQAGDCQKAMYQLTIALENLADKIATVHVSKTETGKEDYTISGIQVAEGETTDVVCPDMTMHLTMVEERTQDEIAC